MKGIDFIKKAEAKHGKRYKYFVKDDEDVFYRHDVDMLCLEHDEHFNQNVGNHLSGKVGCPVCTKNKKVKAKSLTQEQFVEKTRQAGFDENWIDLSNAVYVNNVTHVDLKCKRHNLDFKQKPAQIFKGRLGCKQCLEETHGIKSRTLDDALEDVSKLLGKYLDLSFIDSYEGYEQEVNVVCKIHESHHTTKWKYLFKGQTPCPECKPARISEGQINKVTLDDYLNSIPEGVDISNFDFSRASYIGTKTPVPVRCKKHGIWFEKTLYSVYRGKNGCPQCLKDSLSLGKDEFVRRSELQWGVGRYDYSKVVYTTYMNPVEITCVEHNNTFWQGPESHSLGSQGCRMCDMFGQSKGEHEIKEFLDSLNVNYKHGDRSLIKPLEVDILIDSHKIAIEFNGSYYHSDVMKERNYHKVKHDLIEGKGYQLVTVWEYDWINETKREIIKRLLKNLLGKSDDIKVNARSCELVELDRKSVDDFYEDNHIQGKSGGGYSYSWGLENDGVLVAAMSFKKNLGRWELVRYCTSENVRGGASKLFKNALSELPEGDIVSFSDLEIFKGGLYETLGFEKDKEIPIDYKVYHPKTGIRHKSSWRRKVIPTRLKEINKESLNFDPETDERTEWQMQDEVKALRVWDCGKVRWVYHR